MISEAGLELIVEDIIQNHHLKSLDVIIYFTQIVRSMAGEYSQK